MASMPSVYMVPLTNTTLHDYWLIIQCVKEISCTTIFLSRIMYPVIVPYPVVHDKFYSLSTIFLFYYVLPHLFLFHFHFLSFPFLSFPFLSFPFRLIFFLCSPCLFMSYLVLPHLFFNFVSFFFLVFLISSNFILFHLWISTRYVLFCSFAFLFFTNCLIRETLSFHSFFCFAKSFNLMENSRFWMAKWFAAPLSNKIRSKKNAKILFMAITYEWDNKFFLSSTLSYFNYFFLHFISSHISSCLILLHLNFIF